MNERLVHIEEEVRNIDKSIKDGEKKPAVRPIPPPPPLDDKPKVEVPEEKPVPKPAETEKNTNANNRCLWRNSSPVNTTFEVSFF